MNIKNDIWDTYGGVWGGGDMTWVDIRRYIDALANVGLNDGFTFWDFELDDMARAYRHMNNIYKNEELDVS